MTFEPGELEVLKDGERLAVFVHKETGALWQCVRTVFPFRWDDDVSAWQRQVERQAKGMFLEQWARLAGEREGEGKPRTDDPTWSPIIECERIEIDDEPVAKILHRTAYEPGLEAINCRLLIPIEAGTIEFVCQTTDRLTGMRETVLMAGLMRESDELEHPGQPYFDDPKHDETFSDHALSRSRREVERVLRLGGLKISGTVQAPRGRVDLPDSACSLVPPARFAPLPPAALDMAPSISNLARVSLSSMDGQPILLSVWHLDHCAVPPGDKQALTELAEAIVDAWENEGSTDIRFQARALKPRGDFSAEVEATVDFKVRGQKARDVQRWLADARGSVWRISATGPVRSFSKKQAQALLKEVRATFEVYDVEPPAPPPVKEKRWWWPF